MEPLCLGQVWVPCVEERADSMCQGDLEEMLSVEKLFCVLSRLKKNTSQQKRNECLLWSSNLLYQ